MKKKDIKPYYVEIPVADENVDRFKKGCAHYNMTFAKKRGSAFIEVGFDDPLDLYWLGANMYGKTEVSSLAKWAF